MNKLIESRQRGILPRYVITELENQTKQESTPAISRLIASKQNELFHNGDGFGDFISKQNITLWEYPNDRPEGKPITGGARLDVRLMITF